MTGEARSAAWWRHDCRLNVRELPATTLVCDHCGARKPSAASRPERAVFERTKGPLEFLRWLNAYTNDRRGDDDELHALCSWAHTVIHNLLNERNEAETRLLTDAR